MNKNQRKWLIISIIIIIIVLGLGLGLGLGLKKQDTRSNFSEKYENQNVRANLKYFSVVIVGTCKNIEKEIKNSMTKVEMIGNLFKSYNVILYENDSNDRTLDILKNWEKLNKNIKVISEKNVPGNRTNRLSRGRNILLNEAKKIRPDYLVIVDMDTVIHGLTEENFISSFKYKDWVFMGANQNSTYYDLWALRTYDDWMPFDCWDCVHKKNSPGFNYCVGNRYKKINKNKNLIKVKSAFGGLGIYDMKFILNNANNCVYYGGELNKSEVCEHVSFNECLLKNGGKLFINPNMINF